MKLTKWLIEENRWAIILMIVIIFVLPLTIGLIYGYKAIQEINQGPCSDLTNKNCEKAKCNFKTYGGEYYTQTYLSCLTVLEKEKLMEVKQ